MQRASLGRIVLVTRDPNANNGSDVAPAVICRAWSDSLVNLRILGDGSDVAWMTSVMLFQTREEVDQWRERHAAQWREVAASEPVPLAHAAYWPPQTEG